MTEQNMDTTPLRETALLQNHKGRQAKIVPFAGWQMPLQYTRILEEHQAVRSSAGLFDISHMGLVVLHSGDREITKAFLNQIVPRELGGLYPGKAVYTQLLNEQGGIIDDILIYEMPESETLSEFQEFLIIVNAANTAKDLQWLREQATKLQCRVTITSFLEQVAPTQPPKYSFLALQGPDFADILARTGYDCDHLPDRFHIREALIQGTPVWISRTGYTGEDGVEMIIPSSEVSKIWDLLLDVGKAKGLLPVGLGARDTLRLEAAYPLHGHDITENDTPLEAGLGWSVKLSKSVHFIGKQALLKQKEEGLPRQFVCFTLNHRSIAREGDTILKDGTEIGRVTSGSISPLFNVPIGMGYIKTGTITGPGDTIQISVRDKSLDADVVERPFYVSE